MSDLEIEYGGTLENQNRTPTHRDSFAFRKKEKRRMSGQKNNSVDLEGEGMSIIELMQQIVREPPPRLGSEFDEEAQEFVDACLEKDPDERHTPRTLLVCIMLLCYHIYKGTHSFFLRNIDGWMTHETQISMWQRGQTRFDLLLFNVNVPISQILGDRPIFPITPLFLP